MMKLSIPRVAAMVALVASAAVATGAQEESVVDILRAEASILEDVQGEFEVGEDTGLEAIEWQSYRDLPVVGTLQTTNAGTTRVVTVGAYYDTDQRDVNSLYVSTISDFAKPVIILNDPESGGLLMQLVENRTGSARGKTDGWYLAVHSANPKDRLYPGEVRVIAHRVPEKAAIWTFVEHNGKKVLQVKANRDSTGQGQVGWYLSVPSNSRRDSISDFLTVAPDISSAAEVSMQAA